MSLRNQPPAQEGRKTKGREQRIGGQGDPKGDNVERLGSLRTAGSKQLNDKIYSSVARLPLALPGAWRPGRRVVSGKGRPWAECRMPRVEIRAKTGVRNGEKEGGGWKGPQPYIGGLSYRTFTLQSCVVIYGCRSLIRRIRTPLSPHVCCPSIDPIYHDETGVCKVSLGQKFVSLRTYRFSTFSGTWLGMDNTVDSSSFRTDFYPIITLPIL